MASIAHPVLLVVLDGWGHSEDTHYNAIHSADTPCWDALWEDAPHLLIRACGQDVGLPDQQMGNSEVGHMHIGAGRVVNQDFTRISKAIEDGDFFEIAAFKASFQRAGAANKAVHIMGLLSPGGVHSHEDHFIALMELAAKCGVGKLYIHAFLDGRDTPPKSAAASMQLIQMKCNELGIGAIASVIGRYFAMDRNGRWERVRAAYDLIVDGKAIYQCRDPLIALDEAYARDENDEFVKATAIRSKRIGDVTLEDGDVMVFANFRADRARQLTRAFTATDFDAFERKRVADLDSFISMTRYSDAIACDVAFPPELLANTLGEVVAAHGLKQLRIAETEKYAHVTFFFNGGEEKPFAGEHRILIDSPHVATYDLQPEMSAPELTEALVEAIVSCEYDVIICNYANADMVGHTGHFEATIKCIETLDRCLTQFIAAAKQTGMEILITADHGNAEKLRTVATKHVQGHVHTAHTNNLVPLVYIGRKAELRPSGSLADLAPTILNLMGLPIPKEMTGHALIEIQQASQDAA